jgi:hypothetical protein
VNEIKQYKKVIIPKGTIFFRRALDSNVYETMFFSFDTYLVGAINHMDKPKQVWITKKEIVSNFIIKDKPKPNVVLTDLDYLYELFCGLKEDYIYLKIKENPKRNDFFNYLKKNNIDTWVTSVENTEALEFHIFSDSNNDMIEFKEFINKDNARTYDKINSLSNIKFDF